MKWKVLERKEFFTRTLDYFIKFSFAWLRFEKATLSNVSLYSSTSHWEFFNNN